MAQKTYEDLMSQIAELQAQAENIRKAEVDEAIVRIKADIAKYGLTARDLGLAGSVRRVAGGKSGASSNPESRDVKYRDDKGNTWVGAGPRPRWLKDALAKGRTLESFRVS